MGEWIDQLTRALEGADPGAAMPRLATAAGEE
jgi:hypothetical protein